MPDLMFLTKENNVLDEKLTRFFLSIGIPSHINGYHYLRTAVKLTLKNSDLKRNITKKLYGEVAQRFGTSPCNVEGSIRYAIEAGYNSGKINNINRLFGVSVYSDRKPTANEFIALVADRLFLESLSVLQV